MQAHIFLLNNPMESGWIVSQLAEPVNDYGLPNDKGGALSIKSQAIPHLSTYHNVSEIQQLEE